MTLNELLENAVLDAYGLLDDEQRSAFERAFRAAPRSVRDQIRREQERVAGFESSLTQERPSPELKDRVVAAVLAEMEADRANSELAALALHGGDVSGQVEASGRRYVSGWWQTAAIALMAVSAVLGTFVGVRFGEQGNPIQEQYTAKLVEQEIVRAAHIANEMLAGDEFDRVMMVQSDAARSFGDGASACLWAPAFGRDGYIAIKTQAAPKSTLRVRAVDSAGNVSITEFAMSSQLEISKLSLQEWSGSTVEIAMVDERNNETLLFSCRV